MKKTICILAVFSLVLMTACSAAPPSQPPASSQATSSAVSLPASPVAGSTPAADRAGNAITVPEKVEKIVSMAASSTQILCDLGLGSKLVAVDTYSADNLSSDVSADILQLDMMAPDLEQLAALEPDIIFVSNLSSAGGDDLFAPLKKSGICIAAIPTPDTVAGIMEDVQFLADCTGTSEEGRKLVQEANTSLAEAAELLAATDERPKVYFEVSPSPNLYSTGAGTYLDELVTLAGGANILAGQDGWVAVGEEAVISAEPDVIFTVVDFMPDPIEEILARPGWETVPAIENQAVHFVSPKTSQQPTHHVAQAVWEMLAYIHPGLAQGQAA